MWLRPRNGWGASSGNCGEKGSDESPKDSIRSSSTCRSKLLNAGKGATSPERARDCIERPAERNRGHLPKRLLRMERGLVPRSSKRTEDFHDTIPRSRGTALTFSTRPGFHTLCANRLFLLGFFNFGNKEITRAMDRHDLNRERTDTAAKTVDEHINGAVARGPFAPAGEL